MQIESTRQRDLGLGVGGSSKGVSGADGHPGRCQRLLPLDDRHEAERLTRVARILSSNRKLTTASRMFDYDAATKAATQEVML